MGLRSRLKDHAKTVHSKISMPGKKGSDIRDAKEWPYTDQQMALPQGARQFPPDPQIDDPKNIGHELANGSSADAGPRDINSPPNEESPSAAIDDRNRFAPAMDEGDVAPIVREGTGINDPRNVTKPPVEAIDLTIQFIGARGLPRLDAVGGGADPYFKATLGDDKISYTSTAQKGTMEPVWNEVWHVKNVPKSTALKIRLWDKDDGPLNDDFIGQLETTVEPQGLREMKITGRMGREHGMFFMSVTGTPVAANTSVLPFTFAGPCRYSRHRSPTVGALTALDTQERLYATWKVFLMSIPEFFHDVHQPWNDKYPAAQKIFGKSPVSLSIRGTIHAGHKLLYARTTANTFGILDRAGDLINIFKDETAGDRLKPAVYTYVITDDTWRFSETGAAFFVDFVSKHALHANCARQVRYSGEFHWRPDMPGGWAGYDEAMDDDKTTWELVIDNNSGTYSPDKGMLPALKGLFEYNFPGLKIAALDHADPALKESTDALRKYAKERRGIRESEFIAHPKMGETTLMNMATKMGASQHNE